MRHASLSGGNEGKMKYGKTRLSLDIYRREAQCQEALVIERRRTTDLTHGS